LIVVDHLRKSYGAVAAVRDLSFTVPAGQILGLVGPNGAGKTTTLRCLAGILRPTGGSITIAGVSLADDPVAVKAQLAFIPDEPQLFDSLTVEEHLRFVARLYNVADAESRIGPLLAELELADRRRSFPGELSRGMKQKLATACGLLHDPRVLILDEPLTGLDPAAIRRMKVTILARARAGSAIILSSHLLTLVEELCTRVLVLQNGQRVALGTVPEIVAEHPELAGRPLEDVFLALTGQTETGENGYAPGAGRDPVPGPLPGVLP
jgi:ABC-2 type transport system ATP-binding protein